MNILKEVLKYQVYPAMGCTEPVSVALCAAYAAKELGADIEKAEFQLDAGTYKNGMGVRIPNTDGEKGTARSPSRVSSMSSCEGVASPDG